MLSAKASMQNSPEDIIVGVLVRERRRRGGDWRNKFYAGRKKSKQESKEQGSLHASTDGERTGASVPHPEVSSLLSQVFTQKYQSRRKGDELRLLCLNNFFWQ